MTKYKVIYFDARGRAEVVRLMLAVAGQEFEDQRFSLSDWAGNKAGMPFCQVPVLEVDGEKYWDSLAIIRYLGKQYGMSGKDGKSELRADMITCAIEDFQSKLFLCFFEQDPTKKEEVLRKYFDTTLPMFLEHFQIQMKMNSDKSGYIVGSELTYADIMAFSFFSTIHRENTMCLDKFPLVKKHMEKIGQLPKVKQWLDKRPDTKY